MIMQIPWSEKEEMLLKQFFKQSISEISLYKKIFAINPKRTLKAVTSKVDRMQKEGWIKTPDQAIRKLRIGYLDIETTQLKGDFGYIISWYIKEKGTGHYDFSVIRRNEILKYDFDKRVVKELLLAMQTYDILYTHYGADKRFDIPFIRTRAYKHNFEKMIPKKMECFIMDTWPIARNKLKLHSNRLDSIASAVGIKNIKKTSLSGEIWIRAAVGDIKALQYIMLHNKRDVQLLERVHTKLSVIERAPLVSI